MIYASLRLHAERAIERTSGDRTCPKRHHAARDVALPTLREASETDSGRGQVAPRGPQPVDPDAGSPWLSTRTCPRAMAGVGVRGGLLAEV
jgi:hypothetical protein